MYDELRKKPMQRFKNNRDSMTLEQSIVLILAAVIALIGIGHLFNHLDVKEATLADYAPLYQQLKDVEKESRIRLTKEGSVVITDSLVTYKVENDQCAVTGIFTKDLTLLRVEEKDKALPPLSGALIFVGSFVVLTLIFQLVILFLLYKIWGYALVIQAKSKDKKKAKEAVANDAKTDSSPDNYDVDIIVDANDDEEYEEADDDEEGSEEEYEEVDDDEGSEGEDGTYNDEEDPNDDNKEYEEVNEDTEESEDNPN